LVNNFPLTDGIFHIREIFNIGYRIARQQNYVRAIPRAILPVFPDVPNRLAGAVVSEAKICRKSIPARIIALALILATVVTDIKKKKLRMYKSQLLHIIHFTVKNQI
jgi:hypothetical protein